MTGKDGAPRKDAHDERSESSCGDATWKVRALLALEATAMSESLVTYAELADAAGLEGGQRIHRLACWLEDLMEVDAGKGCRLRAARVISRARGGLPAPGFFIKCRQLGLYDGPEAGAQAIAFHLNCLG